MTRTLADWIGFALDPAAVGIDPDERETPEAAEPQVIDTDSIEPPTTDDAEFGLLDFAKLLIGEPDPVEWIIPEIFAAGLLYQLVAQPKKGKSLLAQDVGVHAATGELFVGSVVPEGHLTTGPVSVLYLDAENSVSIIRDRLLEMGVEPADLSSLHYASFPAIDSLDTEFGAADVLAMAERVDARLIIIDTVSRFVSGGENDAQTYLDLYRLLLAPLKRAGRTVIRIDHVGKDAALGARGSSAKSGDVDVSWILVPGATPQRIKLIREFDRTTHHPESVNLVRRQSPLRHEVVQGRVTIAELVADEELTIDELSDDVRQLVRDLDARTVPSQAGRAKAQAAYMAAGGEVRASNSVWSDAVAFRKNRDAP